MNTSFFMSLKSIFFNSGKIFFSKYKRAMQPAVTGLMLISFASVLIVGCSDNDATKKTDPATQQNNPNGEGEGERGMGDDNRGMDTTHRGMEHGSRGMDSMHREKQK